MARHDTRCHGYPAETFECHLSTKEGRTILEISPTEMSVPGEVQAQASFLKDSSTSDQMLMQREGLTHSTWGVQAEYPEYNVPGKEYVSYQSWLGFNGDTVIHTRPGAGIVEQQVRLLLSTSASHTGVLV